MGIYPTGNGDEEISPQAFVEILTRKFLRRMDAWYGYGELFPDRKFPPYPYHVCFFLTHSQLELVDLL
jgi:hypothetical protein